MEALKDEIKSIRLLKYKNLSTQSSADNKKEDTPMKKLLAVMMAALLALGTVAFAETYRSDDITFEFDEIGRASCRERV